MSFANAVGAPGTTSNRYTRNRPVVLGIGKLLVLGLGQACYVSAAPILEFVGHVKREDDAPKDAEDASLWLYLTVAAILVLTGGAFAGLTIALMGQDGVYLQVIATSGEGKEQRHAESVYRLLQRGKHWVLVTLLLSNVIVNETLPIILDRSLGGGWPAVLGSTVLIVIFGEVIPQSICVRYGLSIGAYMAPFVLGLMWLMAPIAWPIAKLLDKLLGEDHGTVYKKSGLKTLVTLHKTLGATTDRLNQDEVTIISAVLDLKDKAVGDIMTPMGDVFTMSTDTVLDEETMDAILSAGYSRIPIYEPGNPKNFVGMLLVKILITYDPEDCKRVGEFALATLPETRPETSCLDILNFFQEGKSHMVLVSEYPGEPYGATGVTTLEDVVEELISEEIIDESDVYIDVHKAIRRMAPAPKARVPKGYVVENSDNAVLHATADHLIDFAEDNVNSVGSPSKRRAHSNDRTSSPAIEPSLKTTLIRRGSHGTDSSTIEVRADANDMREHLKHLGPSNLASRPKTTRYNSVKIKPGQLATKADSRTDSANRYSPILEEPPYRDYPAPLGGEGQGLLASAGKDARDGVQALQQGYGSMGYSSTLAQNRISKSENRTLDGAGNDSAKSPQHSNHSPLRSDHDEVERQSDPTNASVESLDSPNFPPPQVKRRITRSGSITENVIEAGGVRKVILETTSSSDDADERASGNKKGGEDNIPTPSDGQSEVYAGEQVVSPKEEEVKKKRKRPRKKKGSKGGGDILSPTGSSTHGG